MNRAPRGSGGILPMAEEVSICEAMEARAALLEGFSPFHTAAWARVLRSVYGHCLLPVFLDANSAFLPLAEVNSRFTGCRAVSLPFSDFAGPIPPETPVAPLIEAAFRNRNAGAWRHLEIRFPHAAPSGAQVSASHFGHALALDRPASSLWDALEPSVRRAIRKARAQQHLRIHSATSSAATAAYYRLHCHTRRRHGVPPQPYHFFAAIQREMLAAGRGMICLAEHRGRPVAGAVFLKAGTCAIYKFGASTDLGAALRANNLVMWHAIEALQAEGCATLHFGRTDRHHEGLRRFKLGWGTMEHPMESARYEAPGAARPPEFTGGESCGKGQFQRVASGLASKAFQHLPLAVNRLFGRLLYPHLD